MEATTFMRLLILLSISSFSVIGDITFGTMPYNEWADSFSAFVIKNQPRLQSIRDNGSKEADKIIKLPGQPAEINFEQYSGYISVDQPSQKSLFYYFVESPTNHSKKPLILWLQGGMLGEPGCSSVSFGAFSEIGPFRVKIGDDKTLIRNPYAWNKEANILFLDSPAPAGFSVVNSSINGVMGDSSTVMDILVFLAKWLERYPIYKKNDFYIAGEHYAGHFVPQLASLILMNITNTTQINLKGIIMGNAMVDDETNQNGQLDYLWSHAVFSDETYANVLKFCNFSDITVSSECTMTRAQVYAEIGANFNAFDIYSSLCSSYPPKVQPQSTVGYDPCYLEFVVDYFNHHEVQKAFHAKPAPYAMCWISDQWTDRPNTVLPMIQNLINRNISVWMYSGDFDAVVSVTSTRYAIRKMKLGVVDTWRAWFSHDEIGGYVQGYEGVNFVTIRGAGLHAPLYHPQRALTMINSILRGALPPNAPH